MKLCENQNKVQRPGEQEDFLNSPAPFSSLSSTFPSSCCVFSSCRDSPLHSERSSTRSSSPSASSVCWSPSWPCRRTSWWCRAGSGRAAAAGSSLQREEQKKVCKDFKSDALSAETFTDSTWWTLTRCLCVSETTVCSCEKNEIIQTWLSQNCLKVKGESGFSFNFLTCQ